MSRSAQVDVHDVRRIFALLEKLNSLFHQPLNYRDTEVVERFAADNYEDIKDLYYRVGIGVAAGRRAPGNRQLG